jgi:zinc D-Ala-D-Ala carboxypeptidase
VSNPPSNDIAPQDVPPAQRQPTEISFAEIERASMLPVKPKQRRRGPLVGLLMVASLAGLTVWQWDSLSPQVLAMAAATGEVIARFQLPGNDATEPNPSELATGSPADAIAGVTDTSATGLPTSDAEAALNEVVAGEGESTNRPDTLLNHRRYDEAPQADLVLLNPNSEVKLLPAAQSSLNAMIAKAQADGIPLGVASGFRSIEDQTYLYFEVKAERGESARTRAAVSAPPGYSEHHTGYAVDLMDESRPQTHLEKSFESTPAYEWLQKNAAFFNFEMSFPKNNESQVAYEPWHWRYVGDQDSLELFYKN